MTDHVRAQIRAATVAALKGITGLSGIGRRVYATRRLPLQTEHLPALLVYALAEESAPETLSGPRFLNRDLDLLVEGVAQDNDDLDAVLDEIAAAAETILGAALANPASALRQIVRAGSLAGTQIGLRPPQAPDELGTGHVVLTYRVNYRTRSENPKTII